MSAVCTERHIPPSWTSTRARDSRTLGEEFSGEGLFTHSTTWDLWLHRRVCSATSNTCGLGLPFNRLCNRPPYFWEHRCFLTCCYPLLWVTRPQTLILTGLRIEIPSRSAMLRSRRLEPVVLKKQLTCRCQRYVRSATIFLYRMLYNTELYGESHELLCIIIISPVFRIIPNYCAWKCRDRGYSQLEWFSQSRILF